MTCAYLWVAENQRVRWVAVFHFEQCNLSRVQEGRTILANSTGEVRVPGQELSFVLAQSAFSELLHW